MHKDEIIRFIKSGKLKANHCVMCNNVYGIYLNKLSFQMKKNDFIKLTGEDLTTSISGCCAKCYRDSLIYIFGKGTKNLEDVPDKYKPKINEYLKKWKEPYWRKNMNDTS